MSKITRDEILLTLNASQKIGPRTFQYLAKFFNDDFEKHWQLSLRQLKDILPKEVLDKFLEARDQFSPDKEAKKLNLIKAEYLTIYDIEYPSLLKEIYNPPFVIYYKGNNKILNSSAIAIVGSRKFSQYGKTIGYKLAFDLAQSGLTIVSGLALGLDTVVQRAAVEASGLTIGVLACGIDQIYPATNAELARKIINSDGLILTENPPGTPPMKQHFPARNRIISGLSLGTLVVEAAQSSGSLITAACALEQNREIFAVPGNADSETSRGTNNLIKMGAKPVTEAADILQIFDMVQIEPQSKNIRLSEEENALLNFIRSGPLHIDKIAQASKLDIVAVSQNLTLLELKGAVRHLGGGVYQINIL